MEYDENIEMYHSKIAKKEEETRLLKEELEKFKEKNVNKTRDIQEFGEVKVSCNKASWEMARESVKKGHNEKVFFMESGKEGYIGLTLREARGIVGYLSDKILYLDTGRTQQEHSEWLLTASPGQISKKINEGLTQINKEGGIRK